MKKHGLLIAVAIIAAIVSLAGCATTGLPTFGAEIGSQANPLPGGDPIRIPYNSLISYYGAIEPGQAPDEVVGGKKMYYLYVWVPLVAPEIGVRMVSPVPEGMQPAEADFVAPGFAAADKASYFDPWITVERSATAINPADIVGAKSGKWMRYGTNDDSSELPPLPNGSKYNSLLRLVSEPSDPLKALVRGVYRIGFTTFKVGEVKGTFLAQIGAPIAIPGVVVAKSLDELAAAVKE